MIYKSLITSITFLWAVQAGIAQSDSARKAAQILRIEQALMNALPGDTVLWSRYLDDRWYIITEDGSGFHRAEFLKSFGPFPKGFSGHINVIQPVCAFFGRTAIIHYVADEYEEIWGQQLHTTYATANTWYQVDTSWKMIGSQIFEIPQLPPAKKVPARVLDEYTGTYRLIKDNPLDSSIAHITLKNDTLYVQKNGRRVEALIPETDNIFFRKSDTRGRKLFVRNDQGEMLMLERRNGNDVAWKRER